ncbi:hypothetical protein [Mesobacterium pallidum]|uniref:hypothetical protein n=1 Tax=Mesobacterium pallidum TaxID=2872037 RepID=UPI001EE3267B|nr:hypothetical protein [Mesobacterium pallidum]
MKPMLIAETDETGRVRAVWTRAADARAAHPVRDPRDVLGLMDRAEIHGADRAGLRAWAESFVPAPFERLA